MEIIPEHRLRFAIDIESMLTLPASVFWKDLRGVYLGCNDVMADLISLPSRHTVLDMDDIELLGQEAAMHFVDHDRDVIKTRRSRVVNEFYRNDQGVLIKGFSTKAPLFDDEGKLAGLWGISFLEEVSDDPTSKPISLSSDIQNRYNFVLSQTQKIASRHTMTKTTYVESLSPRETQCIQLLAKGFSAKAIGEELELSKRTVETYIDNIKSKLGCINRTELIIAAIKHKFIDVESI